MYPWNVNGSVRRPPAHNPSLTLALWNIVMFPAKSRVPDKHARRSVCTAPCLMTTSPIRERAHIAACSDKFIFGFHLLVQSCMPAHWSAVFVYMRHGFQRMNGCDNDQEGLIVKLGQWCQEGSTLSQSYMAWLSQEGRHCELNRVKVRWADRESESAPWNGVYLPAGKEPAGKSTLCSLPFLTMVILHTQTVLI